MHTEISLVQCQYSSGLISGQDKANGGRTYLEILDIMGHLSRSGELLPYLINRTSHRHPPTPTKKSPPFLLGSHLARLCHLKVQSATCLRKLAWLDILLEHTLRPVNESLICQRRRAIKLRLLWHVDSLLAVKPGRADTARLGDKSGFSVLLEYWWNGRARLRPMVRPQTYEEYIVQTRAYTQVSHDGRE